MFFRKSSAFQRSPYGVAKCSCSASLHSRNWAREDLANDSAPHQPIQEQDFLKFSPSVALLRGLMSKQQLLDCMTTLGTHTPAPQSVNCASFLILYSFPPYTIIAWPLSKIPFHKPPWELRHSILAVLNRSSLAWDTACFPSPLSLSFLFLLSKRLVLRMLLLLTLLLPHRMNLKGFSFCPSVFSSHICYHRNGSHRSHCVEAVTSDFCFHGSLITCLLWHWWPQLGWGLPLHCFPNWKRAGWPTGIIHLE